ncbi:MAG: phosphatase PAP2 family protein [Bauldia sp.]
MSLSTPAAPAPSASRTAPAGANARAVVARARRHAGRRPPVEGFGVPAVLIASLTLLAVAALALAADAAAIAWAKALPSGVRNLADRLTDSGKSVWTLVPSLIVMLLVVAGDWRRVSPLTAAAWRQIGFLAAFVFLAVAGSGLLNDIVKELAGRARPPLIDSAGPLALRPFSFTYAFQSFPSGHASTFGAIGIAAALFWPRLRWLWLGAALLLACTRVIIGVHYPSDVLTGFVIGAAFTRGLAEAMARLHLGFARIAGEPIRPRTAALRTAWRKSGASGLARGLAEAVLRRPFSPAGDRHTG